MPQSSLLSGLEKCRWLALAGALGACATDGPASAPGGGATTSGGSANFAGESAGGRVNVPPGETGDIGVVPAARLNGTQYNSTVRDLLGTSLQPANGFPADELVLGFDVIAGALRMQPERIEKYLAASDALVSELLQREPTDPIRQRYFTCDVATGPQCWGQVLKNFAAAAWRRPVADAELTAYVAAAQAQPSPDLGLSVALRAVLVSANFLYRWELDPNPDDTTPHLVSGHEMASRLSYALWGTMPDAELLAAADSGALQTAEGVLAQTRRLLDTGAGLQPLVDTFGAQWLNVNQVSSVVPDAAAFPDFDADLRSAMIVETKQFVREFLASSLPVTRLFDADFTYVDARLARHYGIAEVPAEGWHRVPTAGTTRGGLLRLGSFLASTSNPTRTSPVKRGFFVLDRLLCSAPPPPPGDIDLNIDSAPGAENVSVRQRVAQHQQKGTTCFACHQAMDPIGLGLENYDAIGAYREADNFGPIDATGDLPLGDGTVTFDGAEQLSALLATDDRTLPCVVKKLMTFTMGRNLERAQEPLAAAVAAATREGGGSLRTAIEAIVVSDVFRMRRAAAPAEVAP